eukprot:g3551.t1
MANLYKVFIECDCTMLEINPLASLTDGRVLVCDSKVNFDDNASYRQKEIHDQRDTSTLRSSCAKRLRRSGSAPPAEDLLSILGGSPANFLDVGGASTVETMTMAFKLPGMRIGGQNLWL